MKFQRVRRIKGGVLGAHARAITALQETMERIRAGYGIWFSHENNSIAINADRAQGGGITAAGAPALFKGIFLVGWEKTSALTDWSQMTVEDMIASPPTKLWTEFVAGVDAYPWKALRPTWDYVRAWEEP